MKKLGVNALAAAALVVMASPVSAGVTAWNWNFDDCGGNTFATCMSGNVSYTGGVLTVFVKNNGPGVFTQVGIVNVLPAGSSVTAGSAPAGFTWGATALGGAGLGKTAPPANKATVFGYDGPSGNGGLEEGQSGTFTFNIGSLAYTSIGVGVHAQRGPGGCSTKFGIWNQGATTNDVGPTGYDPTCTASVPEPETFVLLVTGLAGLAFVASRRRNGLELIDGHGNNVAI